MTPADAVAAFARVHADYLAGRTTKARWDAARKRRDQALKAHADLYARRTPDPRLAGPAALLGKLNRGTHR